ncbi:hypothetical protein Tco_0010195 [Tanacetum coccineum]
MWNSIQNGPYMRLMIPDPNGAKNINGTMKQILEPLSKMIEGNKKQYIANGKVMNYFLQAIPNDIYNSVDACKNAKEMWKRIKRLMFGFDVTCHVRHLRLMDEFDKFTAKEGELLESVYERLTTFVNIMDRNNVRPISVSINTKILNLQFKPHVLASKAKKATKNHDPLALIAHSNASSSQSHAHSSYSPNHTISSNHLKVLQPTNNRLCTSSNTRNQAVIQDGQVDIQTKNAGYGGNGHYARNCQKPRVCDAKYFREQMLLAMKDEAGSNLNSEENDFMLDTTYGEEIMEDLTVAVMLMARIQSADGNVETVPTYDAKAVSEVNASSKNHEQMRHEKRKTIIQTFDDDQIDSNIIFDDLYVENNGGTSDHDSNDHDEYHKIQMLAYDVQREAKNQKRLNNELKKQKMLLQRNLRRIPSGESKVHIEVLLVLWGNRLPILDGSLPLSR